MSARTYAFADLHGRFDLLLRAFTAISEHAGDQPYKVVTLGDYVDRGPQSRQILQHLMDAQDAGRPLICLKGNHEDIMLQAFNDPSKQEWWHRNGGGQTLASYGGVPDIDHLRWMGSLPLYHEDANRVFVHAWAHPTMPLADQVGLKCYHSEPAMFWTLYRDDDEGGHLGKHVVHGHHQHEHGPLRFSGRTNLDTFAWYSGRLVIGVFNDDVPGGPVEFIEIIGERDPRAKQPSTTGGK